jgi:hypothetical protein
MAGLLDLLARGEGGGLFAGLGAPGGPEAQGLLGGIDANRNAILGYLAGALQGGTLGESIGRGLQGWMGGSQADTALANQRQAQRSALGYAAGAEDIDPVLRTAMMQNPALATQYLMSRLKPSVSRDIAEYEYARRQGFVGTLADWIANKRAGAAPAAVLADGVADPPGIR